MWMMGYNVDDGELSNMPDSFNGRKLRPLIPRPTTCISTNNNTATTNAPCLSRMHGTDLLALNHHLGTVADQSKREFNSQQVVVSSRWNPTPEQLQTLEELYRRGTRTPSADQIQHITSQLRRYGKIEGKNVFYWFQNHKARERQKRRRQLESVSDEPYHDIEPTERKESGANRTGFEVDQTRSWALPTNFSTFAEKTASLQRAAKAGVPECKTDGWLQLEEEGELQQRRSLLERNATWQMMHLSSCSPSTHLINTSNTSTAVLTGTTTTSTTTSATVRTVDPKLIKNPRDLNIFRAPAGREDFNAEEDASCGASETLQLFPLRSGDGHENVTEKETEISVAAMNANFSTPYQFFEFLPLKN